MDPVQGCGSVQCTCVLIINGFARLRWQLCPLCWVLAVLPDCGTVVPLGGCGSFVGDKKSAKMRFLPGALCWDLSVL